MLASASWLPPATKEPTHLFGGLLVVSLFTAAFWTALIAAVGHAAGYPPSALFLATVGITVASYAAVVLMLFASATLDRI